MKVTELSPKFLKGQNVPSDGPLDPDTGYRLMKDRVTAQIRKFYHFYGGDFEELQGMANLAFVEGHMQFNRGKQKNGKPILRPYAPHICLWVWYSLFNAMRQKIKRNRACPTEPMGDVEYPEPEKPKAELDWVQLLHEDAKFIVNLILNPPLIVQRVADAKGREPRNYRSTIRNYLEQVLQWEPVRIRRAFTEIQETMGAGE